VTWDYRGTCFGPAGTGVGAFDDWPSVIVGFRNTEPRGVCSFEIIDPIPVTLDDEGYLVAR
jgi:hypothetical protein